jgi:hypothetical protein
VNLKPELMKEIGRLKRIDHSIGVEQVGSDGGIMKLPTNVEMNIMEGGGISITIFASDGNEYHVKVMTETLLKIIRKKNDMVEEKESIQVGCGFESNQPDYVEITEDDLYG